MWTVDYQLSLPVTWATYMPNLVANDKILAELLTIKVFYKMADTCL